MIVSPTGSIVHDSSSRANSSTSTASQTAGDALSARESEFAIRARLFVSNEIPSTRCFNICSMYFERCINSLTSDLPARDLAVHEML